LIGVVRISAAGEENTQPSKGDTGGYIAVEGAQFIPNGPGLIGKHIEIAGDFMAPMGVAVGNTNPYLRGFLFEPGNPKKLWAAVSFDKVDQEDIDWMTSHLCSRTCPGVFVRGTVAAGAGSLAVLELSEVSASSKAVRGATPSDLRPVASAPMKSTLPVTPQAGVPAPSRPATAVATIQPPTGGRGPFLPVQATQFVSKAQSLFGKDVEIGGAFRTPMLIRAGDTSVMGSGEFVDPDHPGTTYAQVTFAWADQDDIQWIVHNHCYQVCRGVFIRGTVVTTKQFPTPVLALTEISFDSKSGASAAGSQAAESIAAKDRAGAAKSVLAPGTIPEKPSWEGWAQWRNPGAPPNDPNKSVWENMTAHADFKRQQSHDQGLALFRGPDRPPELETSYRSVRDTGLWQIFQQPAFNGQGFKPEWPRVALVVEEKPKHDRPDAMTFGFDAKFESDLCWRLHARAWTGPAKSEEIAPFNWCLSEMRFNVAYSDYSSWGASLTMSTDQTGPTRTLGPTPPGQPLPGKPYTDLGSFESIMVGNMLLDMGFDNPHSDPRVWLNEEPASAH